MQYVKWTSQLTGEKVQYPLIEYDPTKKRTKTLEKRITSMVRRGVPFVLKTSILTAEDDWFVDSGGWVYTKNSEGTYKTTFSHIKNCLPFMEGSRPIWEMRDKRQYKRRNVKRGSLL